MTTAGPPPGFMAGRGTGAQPRGAVVPPLKQQQSVGTAAEGPFAVKETSDVKRNRAQLPSTLIHATPTTGDWLKKRYIVNNYILLDTLGTGSYGEVIKLCLLGPWVRF